MIIRWAVANDVAVVVRSHDPDHMNENLVSLKMDIKADLTRPLEHLDGLLDADTEEKNPQPGDLEGDYDYEDGDGEEEGDGEDEPEEDYPNSEGEDKAAKSDGDDGYRTKKKRYSEEITAKEIENAPEGDFPSLENLKKTAEGSQWGKIGTTTLVKEVEKDDTVVLVTVAQESPKGYLAALNTADGSEHWRFSVNGQLYASPAVSPEGDVLYLATMDWHVYALRSRDGSMIWEYRSTDSFMVTPLIHDDVVYLGNMGGKLMALDAKTGNATWIEQMSQIGFSATPLYYPSKDGDLLYVPTLDMEWSNLMVVSAKDGQMLDHVELGGSATYPPILCKDKKSVFVSAAGLVFESAQLHALHVPGKPKKKWSISVGMFDEYAPKSTLSADGESLYVVHTDGKFLVVATKDGRRKKSINLGLGALASAPLVARDGKILVPSGDGLLYIISPDFTVTKLKIGLRLWTTPALDIDNSILYCGSLDGTVMAVDFVAKKRLWKINVDGAIRAPIELLWVIANVDSVFLQTFSLWLFSV